MFFLRQYSVRGYNWNPLVHLGYKPGITGSKENIWILGLQFFDCSQKKDYLVLVPMGESYVDVGSLHSRCLALLVVLRAIQEVFAGILWFI